MLKYSPTKKMKRPSQFHPKSGYLRGLNTNAPNTFLIEILSLGRSRWRESASVPKNTKNIARIAPTMPGSMNTRNWLTLTTEYTTPIPTIADICAATPVSAETLPRCSSGSWSAWMNRTVDPTLAQPSIPIVHPTIMRGMFGEIPMIASPTRPTRTPPMMNGFRRPMRLRVRSLQIPMKGEVRMKTV